MTEKKRKRGRPKLPTPITEDYASSRRQAVNAMYMYEAVDLIKEAAAEIPNGDALWFADDRTRTAASKNGVLEQIGRMRVQDGFSDGDCIYIANLAADAVNGGFTSREVERTIRAIRLAFKAKDAHRRSRHSPAAPQPLHTARRNNGCGPGTRRTHGGPPRRTRHAALRPCTR